VPNVNRTNHRAKVTASDGGDVTIGKDGAEMVLIPAGEFQMGIHESHYNFFVHTVFLDAFYIDKHEVTVGQYKRFIQATGHRAPNWNDVARYSPTDDHPIIYVSWDDAVAYAEWAGKRLPTEAEWEKAARGGLVGKRYPWGDEAPDAGGKFRANYEPGDNDAHGYTYCAPVGSFPPNGYGLYDMAGNVAEWCLDWYGGNYYASSPKNNPQGPGSGSQCVLRGGGWNCTCTRCLRCANRSSYYPGSSDSHIGFRYAQALRQ